MREHKWEGKSCENNEGCYKPAQIDRPRAFVVRCEILSGAVGEESVWKGGVYEYESYATSQYLIFTWALENNSHTDEKG